MIIEWKDKYSIGFKNIDEHHKHLVDLLNKTYRLMLDGDSKEDLSKILYELIDYANYHFSAEEQLMDRYKHQFVKQHIAEHLYFMDRVLKFEKEFAGDNADFTIEIFIFMKDWLLNHILITDRLMGEDIKEHKDLA